MLNHSWEEMEARAQHIQVIHGVERVSQMSRLFGSCFVLSLACYLLAAYESPITIVAVLFVVALLALLNRRDLVNLVKTGFHYHACKCEKHASPINLARVPLRSRARTAQWVQSFAAVIAGIAMIAALPHCSSISECFLFVGLMSLFIAVELTIAKHFWLDDLEQDLRLVTTRELTVEHFNTLDAVRLSAVKRLASDLSLQRAVVLASSVEKT